MRIKKWSILLAVFSLICSGCNSTQNTNDRIEETEEIEVTKETQVTEETEVTLNQNSISDICNQYEDLELTEDDFKVTYDHLEVGKDTEADQIINALGVPEGYEDNNLGNISNGNGYRRWALSYPDYNEPKIRYLYLSEQEIDADGQEIHGEGYLIGVYLIGVATARDVKVNDTLENVLDKYGRPDNIVEKSVEEVEIQYTYEDKKIEIVLDEENNVKSIFLDYNSEKADEEQGI